MAGQPTDGSLAARARAWLDEDRVQHDATSAAIVPENARGTAVVRAKEHGVLCGLDAAEAVFAELDSDVRFERLVRDGDVVEPGRAVARVTGATRSLLRGERTALNLLQRMSGIATATSRFVDAVDGTGAAILATRKTAPGLRDLDLAAVRAGGGDAHRTSLGDRVLVKENHLFAAREAGVGTLAEVVAHLTGPSAPDVPVGIEVTDLDGLRLALADGIAVVLLDNFTPQNCAEAVRLRDAAYPGGGGPRLEASGGITLENVRAFAEAGVDRISTGAPTHSAPALDLSMKLEHDDGDSSG